MPLHSISKHPPKGWVYRELMAGRYWTAPDPMLPFEDVALALCRARANNKVTSTLVECKESLATYTCKRLNDDARWCLGPGDPQASAKAKNEKSCAGCGKKKRS